MSRVTIFCVYGNYGYRLTLK